MDELNFNDEAETVRVPVVRSGTTEKRQARYGVRKWREIERVKDELQLATALREVYAELEQAS